MFYLFTGNSQYLIKEELKKWKTHFLSKYGEFNFTLIQNIEELDKNVINDNLLASSFLSEKKLVIIDNIDNLVMPDKHENTKEYLFSILHKIPESNIIVLVSNTLQERSLLYKKCLEVGEVRRFDLGNTYETKSLIQKKYNFKIEPKAIDKIIAFKSNNLYKIINELDKLIITKSTVTEKDIIDFITPEFEETIFIFLDKVLNNNKKASLYDLDIILQNTDFYAFYNMFLGMFRNSVYIAFLIHLGCKKDQIIKELSLGNKGFLVDKKHKLNFDELLILYQKIIDFDKNMKLGKLIGSTKEDLKYELQKIIMY